MSLDNTLNDIDASIKRRTWCEYGDCNLEKLENEFNELKSIWTELQENWADPIDYEDLYRIYPLLDTTATLARKRLNYIKDEWSKYKIEIIEPASKEELEKSNTIDTSKYIYSEEPDFYYGNKVIKQLNDIVSTFLHANRYTYHDTRTDWEGINDFEIYLYIRTDFRKEYIKVNDYITALEKFVDNEIEKRK